MKIKELRKNNDITQEQLAPTLGVTNQAVSKWESENGYPDIEYISPIAEFSNVSIDYLFDHVKLNKNFTNAEKEHCIPVILRLIELTSLARKKGILALQRGVNPSYLVLNLLAVLGEEYPVRLDEIKPDDKNKSYNELLSSFKGKEASLESVSFEKMLISLDRFSIQILASEIDSQNLARALYGCSIELICKILDNVSQNKCANICEELMRINSSAQKSNLQKFILQAQSDILKIMEALEKRSAIINRDM